MSHVTRLHRCRCSRICTALVKRPDRRYAHGHLPVRKRKHSAAAKAKMSKYHSNRPVAHAANIGKAVSKHWAILENKIKLRKALLKGWKKPTARRNARRPQRLAYAKGRCISGAVWYRVMYKGTAFRSGWEAKFARWCTVQHIKYEYEPQRFVLICGTYTPDFYLPDFDTWVEIKGQVKALSIRKFRAFSKVHKSVLLSRPGLVALGVLQ